MNKYSDLQLRSSLPKLRMFSLTPKSLSSNPSLPNISNSSISQQSKHSSKISHFSELENSRAEAITSRFLLTPSIIPQPSSLPEIKPVDFKSLIQNLNKVLTRPDLEDIQEIQEKELIASLSAQGSFMYYKVKVKEKRAPMKVEVKRKYGKLRWYISKEWGKPGESQYDFIYFEDIFEVSANGKYFDYEFLFIGVQILIDSDFCFMITFPAQDKVNLHNEIHYKSVSMLPKSNTYDYEYRYNLNQRVEILKQKRKKQILQLSGCKDFVKLNKVPSQVLYSKDHVSWKDRQEHVISKKNLIAQERVQKAKEYINKRLDIFIKHKKSEINQKTYKKKLRQQAWTKILVFLSTLQLIKKQILNHRKKKLFKIKLSASARIIQKTFISKLTRIREKHAALAACVNNLKFYRNTLIWQVTNQVQSKVLNCVKNSASNAKISNKISKLIGIITVIQRKVRNFIKITKIRKAELVKSWNLVLSKLIIENSSLRVNPFTRPVKVELRNKILDRFFNECCLNHARLIKIYFEAFFILPCRDSGLSRERSCAGLPEYSYLPTEDVMRKMIKGAMT